MNKTKRRNISLRQAVFAVGLATLLASIVSYNAAVAHFHNSAKASSATERSLLDYINEVRAQHSVPPLREDPGLDETARIKADDMANRNYWAHTDPDGRPFYFIMLQKRPGLRYYGENLGECYEKTPDMIAGWVGSPGHLENIIKPDYTIFGSAIVWDEDKGCLIAVNHFGKE